MQLFSYILEAIIPILALVVAGYAFRKSGFLGKEFWHGAESLAYFVLFPALLIHRLSNADFSRFDIMQLMVIVFMYFVLITVLAWWINKKWLSLANESWTSFLQGSIRFNTFVVLALTDKLFGPQLYALSALLLGMCITIVNVITIISFNTRGKVSPGKISASLIENPLILACLIGIFLNVTKTQLPVFIGDTLAAIAPAALPVAILAVGAGLKIKSLSKITSPIIYSSVLKLIISPLIMALLCLLLISDHLLKNLLIIFACVPTASSAYILSRKLKGNAELMATIITFETVVSILSITVIMLMII